MPRRSASALKRTAMVLATVMVPSLVAGGAAPALAITNGTADNVHTNVGAVIFDQLSRSTSREPDSSLGGVPGRWYRRESF